MKLDNAAYWEAKRELREAEDALNWVDEEHFDEANARYTAAKEKLAAVLKQCRDE